MFFFLTLIFLAFVGLVFLKIVRGAGTALDYFVVALNSVCFCLACRLHFGSLVTFEHGAGYLLGILLLAPVALIFSLVWLLRNVRWRETD